MPPLSYIKNVAIVGAGGNSGTFITQELLKTGRHAVSAITRIGSQNKMPEGVAVKRVDYDQHETLVQALRDQDVLVVTLSGRSSIQETEAKLVRAAAEADVPWILPNEWSPDTANEKLVSDIYMFKSKVATRELIKDLGKSSYIGISTGFWYEWSLGNPKCYGINIPERTAVFFDDGDTKTCTTTWPQVGRAVASLLSLPIEKGSDVEGPTLDDYRNKVVYINSFTISQRDMLDSILRVTDTKESDWSITKEPVEERWQAASQGVKEGKFESFAAFLYSRIFFKDGVGNFEKTKGTLNSLLGLPKEDLDAATQRAMERQLQALNTH